MEDQGTMKNAATARWPRRMRAIVGIVGALMLTAALSGCSPFGLFPFPFPLLPVSGGVDPGAPGETHTGPTSPDELRVGDCIDYAPDYAGTPYNGVTVLSCEDEHLSEIAYAAPALDGPFPGEDAASTIADGICMNEFGRYTGETYDDSSLDFGYDYPTSPETWEQGGPIICFVFDYDGEALVGSVRDHAAA